MAITTFPDTGDAVTEGAWQALTDLIVTGDHIVTGFSLTDGTGLDTDIIAGTALVNGVSVVSDATITQALTDNATNYVFLNDDGTITDNTTGTNPGTSLLLGKIVTSGGSITSLTHVYSVAEDGFFQVTKSADQTKNNDAALGNDSELFFTAPARTRWLVEFFILPEATGSSGFKSGIIIPSGGGFVSNIALAEPTAESYSHNAITYHHTNSGTSTTETFAGTGMIAGSANIVRAIITIGQTAGTVAYQWAQNASNADDSTVKAGSTMIVRRLPG